jgi:hypothetical protein
VPRLDEVLQPDGLLGAVHEDRRLLELRQNLHEDPVPIENRPMHPPSVRDQAERQGPGRLEHAAADARSEQPIERAG